MKWGRDVTPPKNIRNNLNHFKKVIIKKKQTSNNSLSSITGKLNLQLKKKKKPTLVQANTEISLYCRVIQASGFCSFNRHTTNSKSLRWLKEGSHPSENRLMQKTRVAKFLQPAKRKWAQISPLVCSTSNLFINHLLHPFQITGTPKNALMLLAHFFKLNLIMLVEATSCIILTIQS